MGDISGNHVKSQANKGKGGTLPIGLITIHGYQNYGNRLQNYATQCVLESLGYGVVSIRNHPNTKPFDSATSQQTVHFLKRRFIHPIMAQFRRLKLARKLHMNKRRAAAFEKFTTAHIRTTDYQIDSHSVPAGISDAFSVFVAGSDQIWNPYFRNCNPNDFLAFAPPEKRVAYASSFGIDELPESVKDQYRQWLSGFAHLSVREQSGARIIKELTGRDALVLLDPTLMLSKEEWFAISCRPRWLPNSAYVVTYFLGQQPHELPALLSELKTEKNLQVVHLGSYEDARRFYADPGEFLAYINSASMVLTDSFHGAVFSILFERPFIVFQRSSHHKPMGSRLDTLLDTFQLTGRKWEEVKLSKQHLNCDFSHVSCTLARERRRALDYLSHALEGKSAQ